jgi:RNA polymerase primary sigma factor
MPSLVQKVATNPAGNLAPLDSASESLGVSGVVPTSAGGDSPLLRTQRRSNAAIRARTISSQSLPTALQTAGASRRANGAIRAAASLDLEPGRRASEVEDSRRQTELRPLSSGEEARLNEILSEPMDYIDHPEYHVQGAEERIYGFAEIERPDVTWYRPLMDDFISARNRGTRSPKSQSSILLTGAQERILFMKYNYARFQVSEIQQKAAGRSLTLGEARTTLRWHAVAMQYREQLAETNLALVLAMAKRVRLAEVDFADLIGEGNMALMRSVDKFDCGRGFKFSTYACRAILKAFSRHGIKVTTQRKRFGAEYDPILEKSNHLETVRATHERECADEVKHILFSNKADLTQIERAVIGFRFGFNVDGSPLAIEAAPQNAAHASARASIDDSLSRSATPTNVATNSTAGLGGAASPSPSNPPLTLEQVGQVVGLTKERVRQIQNKALEKIKLALHASNPDAASDMAVDIATREGRLPQKFAQSEN